jgi:hypothetical protein
MSRYPMKIPHLPLLLGFVFSSVAAEPPVPAFRVVDVDTNIAIGYGLAVADIDGDRKPDIVLADKNHIVWYQNPGWQRHVMAEKLTQLDHVCIAALDIDGDGKAEVAAGAGWQPGDTVKSGSVHYLIPPADRTQRWEPVQLPHEPTVHRMRWVKNSEGKYDLVVVPLHGRGNKGGEGQGVRVLAYQMPENPRDPWETQLVDDSLHLTHNFHPVKWTRAPGDELLVGAKEGVFHLIPNGSPWKRHQIIGNKEGEPVFAGAGEVREGKLSAVNSFVATIEPMHGNALVIYTAPRVNDPDSLWKRKVIDETLVDGHALACGDLLGLGRDQIVAGWRAMNRPGARVGIRIYIPLDPEGSEWKQATVDDNTMACEDLCLADVDGDGKLDIIAAGRATRNLKVYFNLGAGK